MKKNVKNPSSLTTQLSQENKALREKLRKASTSIVAAIRAGNIDALLVGVDKNTKIYSEKTSDKIYRILIEKMHEGAITLNGEGTILYCNSFFAKMVNLPLQKVIGTVCADYIESSSKHQFDASVKNSWKSGGQSEIAIARREGKAMPVLMSVNSLSPAQPDLLSVVFTDLTARNNSFEELTKEKQKLELTNNELENANKDLTIFTYISSHDLQEPLRKIQSFVKLILEDQKTTLSYSSKMYFERSMAAAIRMQALIDDLLVYSQAKHADRKFVKVDLNLIVEEVKKDCEEIIKSSHAVISTHLGAASILRSQFGQVIQNLITNSIKFSKANAPPHIRIESKVFHTLPDGSARHTNNLSPEIEYCHIIYTDNGIGFDPQYNERIFEVFQRLHNRDKYKGTGMGLAICKRIVENHHGIITASGQLNKGARFDIYIPVKSATKKIPHQLSQIDKSSKTVT